MKNTYKESKLIEELGDGPEARVLAFLLDDNFHCFTYALVYTQLEPQEILKAVYSLEKQKMVIVNKCNEKCETLSYLEEMLCLRVGLDEKKISVKELLKFREKRVIDNRYREDQTLIENFS